MPCYLTYEGIVELSPIPFCSQERSHTHENHFESGADCLFMFEYYICNIKFSLSNSCLGVGANLWPLRWMIRKKAGNPICLHVNF